uniref:F-box domain-containing protein n=1 Tax=Parastrongyloides trichosuri TaxID=131310 RepID=A0A0N5A7F2_PARTI
MNYLIVLTKRIEKLFLDFDHFYLRDNEDEFSKRLTLIKNKAIKQILQWLNENLKVLYLKNIPNLDLEMCNYLTKNCSNLKDIYLDPYKSINVHFIEKLNFVYLGRLYNLNIPECVEMLYVNTKKSDDSEVIEKMNDNDNYTYFKNKLKRNFKIVIRNYVDKYENYTILYDNKLEWEDYHRKIDRIPF